MKALQEGDRGRREALFYRRIFVEDPGDDEDAVTFLRDFVPKFYRVVQVRQKLRTFAQDKMSPFRFESFPSGKPEVFGIMVSVLWFVL